MHQFLHYLTLGFLWKGLLIAVEISVAAFVTALPFALGVALMRMSRKAIVRWLPVPYIWVMRGTPILLRLLTSINAVFMYAQRGCFDYGFIGAGQIDQFGSVNTSYIGDPDHPKVRLPGSGGANDIVSSCREIFVMTRHEPRRFVERVDFVTSPGYLTGPEVRRKAGLLRSRPVAVVTDLALLNYDEQTGRLRLEALQPGVTEKRVHESTGFELLVSESLVELPAPTDQELAELRWLRDGESTPSIRQESEVTRTS